MRSIGNCGAKTRAAEPATTNIAIHRETKTAPAPPPPLITSLEPIAADERSGAWGSAFAQFSPAYECSPDTTMFTKNRLNMIETNPTTEIQAARRPRQPAVERACRYDA